MSLNIDWAVVHLKDPKFYKISTEDQGIEDVESRRKDVYQWAVKHWKTLEDLAVCVRHLASGGRNFLNYTMLITEEHFRAT